MMLLDINLPGMSGLELLEKIKTQEALKAIPVVMLTSSEDEEDLLSAYKHQCAGYIVKPVGLEGLIEKLSVWDNYWFTVVKQIAG
jgi:CheY-like chemotaxis protein